MMKTLAALVILGSGTAWADASCLHGYRLFCPGDTYSGYDDGGDGDDPDSWPDAWLVLAGVGVAVADLTFTILDISKAADGERLGEGAAIAEIVVAAPQVALFASIAARDDGWAVGMTVWSGALAVHALATLLIPETVPPSVTLAPAYLRGGGGLVASGSF